MTCNECKLKWCYTTESRNYKYALYDNNLSLRFFIDFKLPNCGQTGDNPQTETDKAIVMDSK